MAVVSGKRRGRGEDSIFWDDAKSRYVGAVSLGYSPPGTRARKKVMGRTKTEVRKKLRGLHQRVKTGYSRGGITRSMTLWMTGWRMGWTGWRLRP